MSKRPPNEVESQLHKAVLSTPKKEMTAKETETVVPDPSTREKALNFLLGVGLLKILVDSNRKVSFRAVTKGELVVTKDLNGEENLVLSHIKAADNEGIWTKHLKTKTNLHQTIIDRCLKTLTQKRLIKRVPSVQHPTRKIYMLEGLEPSISLTGGPWYTDNELDTEFIQLLTDACYKFIHDLSFPKRKEGGRNVLYGISNPPNYPTAQHIRTSLKKARITETELSVEHVEMLLNVLVLDEKIEKLPAFGTSVWDSIAAEEDDSGTEEAKNRKNKRKLSTTDSEDEIQAKKKKRKDKDSEGDSSTEELRKKAKKRRQKKKAKNDDGGDSDSDPGAENKKKGRRQKKDKPDSESSDESSDEASKRKKRKQARVSDLSSSEEEDAHRRRKNPKGVKHSSSSFQFEPFETPDSGNGSVYRAIKEEQPPLTWSEAPCSLCPSFDFCKDAGPVNPVDCVYYGGWLTTDSLSTAEG